MHTWDVLVVLYACRGITTRDGNVNKSKRNYIVFLGKFIIFVRIMGNYFWFSCYWGYYYSLYGV